MSAPASRSAAAFSPFNSATRAATSSRRNNSDARWAAPAGLYPAMRAAPAPPAPAAYAVTAQVNGKTYTASGSVAVEQFQLVVLEFELQEGSADAQLAETN